MIDLTHANQQLHQQRANHPRHRPAPSPDPIPLADIADGYPLPTTSHLPPPNYRPVTFEEARQSFNLPSLDQLTTSHLPPAKAEQFDRLLATVRRWRGLTAYTPGLSCIILSPNVGIGKTHIAQSVSASYSAITGDLAYEDDQPLFTIEHSARVYTARELITQLADTDLAQIAPQHIRCIVIDDLGREGYLPYVKNSDQLEEKRSRYFHLIDHIYKRRNGRSPVSLFITSNLLADAIENLLGTATWDRLLELAPRGYINQIDGLPSYRRIVSGRAT